MKFEVSYFTYLCVLLQIFRKEPFFYGHDNYDQLVKIARVSVACEVVATAPDCWVMCVWEIIQYYFYSWFDYLYLNNSTLGTWLCCKCTLLMYLVFLLGFRKMLPLPCFQLFFYLSWETTQLTYFYLFVWYSPWLWKQQSELSWLNRKNVCLVLEAT